MSPLFRKIALALGPLLLAAIVLLWTDTHNRSQNTAHRSVHQSTPIPHSQSRPYRVAVAYLVPEPGIDAVMRGIRSGFEELGIREGKDIVFRFYHAQGEISQIAPMGQALESGDADAILTLTTPVLQGVGLSARRKPVVFTYVVDPIAAGAGERFDDHRPNLTGIGSLPPVQEMLKRIRQVLPNAKIMATLYNPSEANSVKVVSMLRSEADPIGMRLVEVPLHTTADAVTAMQAALAQNPDVVVSAYDNTFYEVFETVSEWARKAKIPLVIDQTDYLERGALMAVGINFEESGRAAAEPLLRVLTGTPPSAIPINNVARVTLGFNPDVANTLGIDIPADLLQFAEKTAGPSETARKQPLQIRRVIYLESAPVDETLQGMDEGFRSLGLVEGRDYVLKDLSAQGDMSVLSTLADRLRGADTDLIIALSTPTLETLLQRVQGKPIVFTFVADPIVAGAGQDHRKHLPEVTGVYTEGPYAEMVDLLAQHFPNFKQLGTLYAPNEDNSVHNLKVFQEACRKHGILVTPLPVTAASELSDAALALASRPVDAIVQILDNQSSSGFTAIARAAERHHKPLFAFIESGVHQGAALALTMDYHQAGFDAALKVGAIMQGESPETIPFSRPSKIRLVISPDHAAKMGLDIPNELLLKADLLVRSTK